MTQMWLLWWPKNNASAKTATSSTSGAVTATSVARKPSSSHCNCVAKLLRKLKKRSRVLCSTTGESSSSSFQCRYDPLSYSLNFDTSGCGSLLDEHYYQFCAFSSRFASNPGNVSHSAPHVTVTTSR